MNTLKELKQKAISKVEVLEKTYKIFKDAPLKNFWAKGVEKLKELIWTRVYLIRNDYGIHNLNIKYGNWNEYITIYFNKFNELENNIKDTLEYQKENLIKIKKDIEGKDNIKDIYLEISKLYDKLENYDYEVKEIVKDSIKYLNYKLK